MTGWVARYVRPVPIAKAIIFCVPVLVAIWLTVEYLSVFGHLAIRYDFSKESAQVNEFGPAGRALDREENLRTNETYQRIVGEPVYMNVSVPRSYDSVTVALDYQNTGQSYVEFGVVTSEDPYAVRLFPMDIGVINQAQRDGWSAVTSTDGTTLLQRTPVFDSIDAFLNDVPKDAGIGTYRYRLAQRYHDPAYVASPKTQVIDRALRGGHEFWTYADGETLHAEFDLTDMNRAFDADPISIQVYKVDELIHEEVLSDDGDVLASGVAVDRGTLTVDLPSVEAGLYRLVVTVTDDIVIRQIRTDQERFVARDAVFLANNVEYAGAIPDLATSPTNLYVQGGGVMMQTDHPNGLQVPTISGEPIHIDEPHVPYWWNSEDPVEPLYREVIVPLNDATVRTSGLIAFSEASFFDADYQTVQISDQTNVETLDYIIYRDYVAPVVERTGFSQTLTIPLDGIAGDRKDLKFILSAPGIDRERNELKIREVQFDFEREPLWSRLKSRLSFSS